MKIVFAKKGYKFTPIECVGNKRHFFPFAFVQDGEETPKNMEEWSLQQIHEYFKEHK